MNNKIIWSEGMLLRPQHFQQQDRYFEYLVTTHSTLRNKNNFGLCKLIIDENLLNIGKVAVISCEGITPDGTIFSIPNQDAAPEIFDIPSGLSEKYLYLRIPLRHHNVKEFRSDNDNYLARYKCKDVEINDCNAGFEQTSLVQVGQINLEIAIDNVDLANYSILPFLKIKESHNENVVQFDSKFIPPILNIFSNNILSRFVNEVQALLDSRSDSLANRLIDSNQSSTAEMADYMLLQLINRYTPLFNHYIHENYLHPQKLYETLIQLFGELLTYTNTSRRPEKLPHYNHNKLFETFSPLMTNIRKALTIVLERNAESIPLEQRQFGIFVASIADKNILSEADFILAVSAEIPRTELINKLPNQIKICAPEHIKTLIMRSLPGIDLEHLTVAPRQIPYHANYVYFLLNKKHEYWQMLKTLSGIAIHIGGNFPNINIELWAIKRT